MACDGRALSDTRTHWTFAIARSACSLPGRVDPANVEVPMHRSRLATIVIDCQTERLDEAASFWGSALGRPARSLNDPKNGGSHRPALLRRPPAAP